MSFLDWFRTPPAVRFDMLGAEHAPRLAALHATGFARPWDSVEFERLLGDRAIFGDGLFMGAAAMPSAFILSRLVLDEAEILTIAVGPDLRGKGLSRPLLAHHLDGLVRRGARIVHLEVEEGNGPALALYRRLGFREVGRRDGYYLKPDSTRATALTMSLSL